MIVLQINATYGVGSTGRNVLELDQYLKKQGHDSYVAWGISTTEGHQTNLFQVGNWFDHKWHALAMRLTGKQGYYSRYATKRLCKKIDEIQPDVIHLHNLHSNYICIPILLKHLADRDYPVVITLHDCWFFTGRCYHYLEYQCAKWQSGCEKCELRHFYEFWTDESKMLQVKNSYLNKLSHLGIIGVSEWIAGEARKSILKNSTIIETIYNWIDCDIFKPADISELRKKMNIGNRKVILGACQEWTNNKGLCEMIQIAQNLGDEGVVLLLGKVTNTNDLPSNILSLGYITEVKQLVQYYSLADVFVNPSKMETFGKVSAEAMACGTPVVVYNNTGNRELISEGCGEVAQDRDVQDFIVCVRRVLERGKDFYTKQCIIHARNKYDMDKQLQKHCDLYNKLIKRTLK